MQIFVNCRLRLVTWNKILSKGYCKLQTSIRWVKLLKHNTITNLAPKKPNSIYIQVKVLQPIQFLASLQRLPTNLLVGSPDTGFAWVDLLHQCSLSLVSSMGAGQIQYTDPQLRRGVVDED